MPPAGSASGLIDSAWAENPCRRAPAASVGKQGQVLDVRQLLCRLEICQLSLRGYRAVWRGQSGMPFRPRLMSMPEGFCQVSLTGPNELRDKTNSQCRHYNPTLALRPPRRPRLTGSQPSSSTNKLSDRSVGGGGLCEGRKSNAPIREAPALAVPRCGIGFGTCPLDAAVGSGCGTGSGRVGCGASGGAALVLQDAASSPGPALCTAFLRPLLVFWLGLLPRSPTVMTRNSHEMASLE